MPLKAKPSLEGPDIGPPCCDGKENPCCDATCIDRIVLRECGDDDNERNGTSTEETKKRRATIRHRYTERLDAIGCICRALISLGQETCCITKPRPSNPYEDKKPAARKKPLDKCCDKKSNTSIQRKSPYSSKDRCRAENSACEDACCERTQPVDVVPEGTTTTLKDPEKGLSAIEHVVLSLSGMTCTGCETKVQRVLGNIPAVDDLKTSLVMARTEFNLNTGIMSVEDVIKHLERTTEFKCQTISIQGSTIEVISQDAHNVLDQQLPFGVNQIQLVEKNVLRINFDSKVIGARALLDKGFIQPLKLAPLRVDPGLLAGDKHVRDLGYMTLFSCILTIPVLVLAWAPLPNHEMAYAISSLVLASVVQFLVAGPFYPKAIKALVFSRIIEMDLLIVLSTSAAYVFSVVSFGYLASGNPLSIGEFFETSTLLVSLIMVGRWVGALARQKAIKSISIRSLQPSLALLVTQDGTPINEVDTRLLQYGDVFCVLPEHRIPTDGIIIDGVSELDESMLTGESIPVGKAVGDRVVAGSINGSGKLVIRLTHLPDENTISTIAGMVDEAKLSKPKIQHLADQIAAYFVPVIIFLTVVTFVAWIAVGVHVRKQNGSEAAIQAITFAITVLIVSCPCAIGLAVPMVIVIGSGVAAERGIIFKSAESIEIAHKTTHVVFDKTGTLTAGRLTVSACYLYEEDNSQILYNMLGLVTSSKHPVSAAVARYLLEKGVRQAPVHGIKTITGKGVEGSVPGGEVIRGGNARWLGMEADPNVAMMLVQGYTVFCVVVGSRLCAVFGLSDSLRPDAALTVSELLKRGIHVSILSGDEHGAVKKAANELVLDIANVRSACSPVDKQEYIRSLLTSSLPSGKKPIVVFVGDGTNDAVALAQASIGVHMNSGTDVAKGAADVVLMRSSLKAVVNMIDVSRASVRRIKFNFAWAFVYNVMAVLLASGALVAANGGSGVRIPPEYAGLGELVSVLPVIGVALGLKWARLRNF
ncbi:E1-E2 ATPase-domain-containing protein [Truncatella angustata]|uniref:E1-E2 ATPase-domain-containing protein n=1 Tax=Truncatella angustata TaxID=152316 RepID=A0A9P8UU28_9PEZI|nr:E1-E2 ATPase-domain-containing protein [Truncatella angustata]KAH6658087.1 E1-E2 ATPase-domain-containing protein [Truncatella angustata]